jgi:putative DNA primase/helicase
MQHGSGAQRMSELQCVVTFFTDYAAASKTEMILDLDDLARRIRTSNGSDKASLPWLKMARFGDIRTKKSSLRHDDNMISISGIEADYDGETIAMDEAVERLRAAKVLCIVYTSPSHTEDAPRWRVLCPLSQEYTPDERDRFLARLNGLFGGVFADESWTRSQSYYYGSINHNPSHRVVVLDATPIDLIGMLDTFAIRKPEKAHKGNGANGAGYHGPPSPPEAITDRRINGLIESLLSHIRNAPDGQKYFTLRDISFTIGGYLHLTNWSVQQAVEACVAALPSAQDWEAARKTATAAIEAGRDKPLDLPDRPGYVARVREKSNGAHAPEVPPVGDPIPLPPPSQEPVESEGDGRDPPDPPGDDGPAGRPVPPEIPVIPCIAGEMPRMARAAEQALISAGVEVYQRHKLVRPVEEEYPAADNRITHSAALLAYTPASLFKLLSSVAKFQKFNRQRRTWVECDPPDKLVQILLDGKGDWTFPHIRGVLTCPTLRADGSVLKDRGYDPASRYYLAMPSNLVLPDMVDAPSRQDAEAALARLGALLVRFPFVDEVSRAVAFCILLTQVLRCAMQVSPMLAVSATAPSSGKSFLVDLASAIALGRPCPVIPPGKNEEETEKGIRTKLLSGTPAFSIDNIHQGINMPLLNMATERTHISIRLFSVLEEVEVENSVVIYSTGNNLEIIDEQGRRTVRCCMDSGEERPEHRVFDVNPIDTVMADRGSYIADILTIARAYLGHLASGGARPDIPPMGDSHKTWSRLVREPLVWLGQQDPLTSQEITRQDDPVSGRLSVIIDAWHLAFGMEAKTLSEVSKYATTIPVFHADRYDTDQNEINLAAYNAHKECQETLLAALRDGFAAGKDGVNTHAWGNWMRRFAGRVSGGLRFERVKEDEKTKHKGALQWKLVKA